MDISIKETRERLVAECREKIEQIFGPEVGDFAFKQIYNSMTMLCANLELAIAHKIYHASDSPEDFNVYLAGLPIEEAVSAKIILLVHKIIMDIEP